MVFFVEGTKMVAVDAVESGRRVAAAALTLAVEGDDGETLSGPLLGELVDALAPFTGPLLRRADGTPYPALRGDLLGLAADGDLGRGVAAAWRLVYEADGRCLFDEDGDCWVDRDAVAAFRAALGPLGLAARAADWGEPLADPSPAARLAVRLRIAGRDDEAAALERVVHPLERVLAAADAGFDRRRAEALLGLADGASDGAAALADDLADSLEAALEWMAALPGGHGTDPAHRCAAHAARSALEAHRAARALGPAPAR
jgi:hypothetical protein